MSVKIEVVQNTATGDYLIRRTRTWFFVCKKADFLSASKRFYFEEDSPCKWETKNKAEAINLARRMQEGPYKVIWP